MSELNQRNKFVCIAMCFLVMSFCSRDVISRLTGLTCSKSPGFWMVEHQLVANQVTYFHRYNWLCHLAPFSNQNYYNGGQVSILATMLCLLRPIPMKNTNVLMASITDNGRGRNSFVVEDNCKESLLTAVLIAEE